MEPTLQDKNTAICTFMKWTPERFADWWTDSDGKTLTSFSNWEYLMEALYKIRRLGYRWLIGEGVTVITCMATSATICTGRQPDPYQATHEAIYQFVVWYNNNRIKP